MRRLSLASVLLGCTLPAPVMEGADEGVKLDTNPENDPTWSWGEEIGVDQADASVIGESAKYASWPMALVGDVNGDGIDDVSVGCTNSESSPNRVYMLYGRRDSWALEEHLSSSIVGSADIGFSGWAVGVGDVNGDGLSDVGIAGMREYEYLMLGSSDPWPVALPVSEVDVAAHDDALASGEAGSDVRQTTPVGDVDGDGLDDWFLLRDWGNSGEAVVLSGASLSGDVSFPGDAVALALHGDASEPGEASHDTYYTPLGDITGDGHSDLGAYDSDGPLFITSGTSTPAESVEPAAASSAQFDVVNGYVVGLLGDLDLDGVDDIAISRDDEATYVFFGGPKIDGVVTMDQADVVLAPGFGASEMPPVGDLNGDGLREVALLIEGASMPDSFDVVVFFGRTTWPHELDIEDADLRIRGTSGEETLQFLSSMIGDIDGDGMDELFLATPYESWAGMTHAGTVGIFRGRRDWPPEIDRDDPDLLIHGSVPYQQLGFYGNFVVTDINGDGDDDMLTSTRWYEDTGAVFFLFGHPTP